MYLLHHHNVYTSLCVCVFVLCKCVRVSHISCFEGADGIRETLNGCCAFGGHHSSVPSALLQSRIKIRETSEFMRPGLEIMYGAINYKCVLMCLGGRMDELINFYIFMIY